MAEGKSPSIPARTIFKDPVHVFAFGLGSGLAPKAPGTFGTLAAIPVYGLLIYLPLWAYIVVLSAMLSLGIWLCGESARRLGCHDHGGIVWDEWVGFLISMLAAPKGWIWLLMGFGLFRLFDIWKPWPIKQVDQQVQGGLGIMLDDVIAGLYALGIMQLIAHF